MKNYYLFMGFLPLIILAIPVFVLYGIMTYEMIVGYTQEFIISIIILTWMIFWIGKYVDDKDER